MQCTSNNPCEVKTNKNECGARVLGYCPYQKESDASEEKMCGPEIKAGDS